MTERLSRNTILTPEEKEALLDGALLVDGFARTEDELAVFDQCVIGTTNDEDGNTIAVYSYERLATAFWWLEEGEGIQFDMEEWDYIHFGDPADNSGLHEAMSMVSENYLMLRRKRSPIIVGEYLEPYDDVDLESEEISTFTFREQELPIIGGRVLGPSE